MSAMSLAFETTILALGMSIICVLPFVFRRARSTSGMPFLFGTGALFGICLFDLLPDIFEMGGNRSLAITIAVSIAYSIVHLVHLSKHRDKHRPQHRTDDHEGHAHDHGHRQHEHSLPIFFFSIVIHCFASGVLLSVSKEFSEKLAGAVFFALLGHKGYEAIVFVTLLINHRLSRKGYFASISVYCLALPAGVVTSQLFADHISESIAIYVSSIAVGSLLGCLIFDFMIPSFHQVKRQRLHAAWLLIGLVLTRLVMGYL